MEIRTSEFAGSWYPGKESECRKVIEGFSREAFSCPVKGKPRIGGIVPHAGWIFSGKIAFSVINCLRNESAPDTFIIFGKHLHQASPNYIMTDGSWSTPLGDLVIDQELGNRLVSEFIFNVESRGHYEQDNTIEVQLPFIKYLFPDVMILPIGLPPKIESIRIGERVAELAKEIGRNIFILGSTDLTHYGNNYGYAPKGTGKKAVEWVKNENDKKIVDLMINMDSEGVIRESLKNYNACCSGAVASAISGLKKMGVEKGEKLIYSTSYDVRPDSSFVGYAGIVY